jgi:hypothetical protein
LLPLNHSAMNCLFWLPLWHCIDERVKRRRLPSASASALDVSTCWIAFRYSGCKWHRRGGSTTYAAREKTRMWLSRRTTTGKWLKRLNRRNPAAPLDGCSANAWCTTGELHPCASW